MPEALLSSSTPGGGDHPRRGPPGGWPGWLASRRGGLASDRGWSIAACLLAAFVTRWAALAAMLVAAAGALTVFLLYARVGGTVTWHQATALVAYGLTIILTLMILVEQKVEPKGDVCESL